MDMPKVTVCIPVHNGEDVLYECLKSISQFDYENYNIVVVDNASTQDITGIVDLVKVEESINIEIARYEELVPAEVNFNRCKNHASGKYFAVYHADDIYNKDILRKESEFLELNESCACVLTLSRHVDHEGNFSRLQFLPNELKNKKSVLLNQKDGYNLALKYGNIFHCPSAMFRYEDYIEQGYKWDYDNYGKSADFALWMKIVEKRKIGIVLEYLTDYRLGANSFSYNYMKSRVECSDMLYVLGDVIKRYEVTDRKLLNYVKILELKDQADLLINRVKMGLDVKELTTFNMVKTIFGVRLFFSIFHLKIVIWSLLVVLMVHRFTPNFMIDWLLDMRYSRQ